MARPVQNSEDAASAGAYVPLWKKLFACLRGRGCQLDWTCCANDTPLDDGRMDIYVDKAWEMWCDLYDRCLARVG